MAIYKKQKIGFIHIPKVAGTSIRTLLDKELDESFNVTGDPHESLVDMKLTQDYNIFCVIRDPITRAQAHYNWFRNRKADHKKLPHKILAVEHNFTDWLVKWFIPKARTQVSFFEGTPLSEGVTVLRYEHLKEDLDLYLNSTLKLAIDVEELPHIFKIETEPPEFNWTADLKKQIREKETWLYEKDYY